MDKRFVQNGIDLWKPGVIPTSCYPRSVTMKWFPSDVPETYPKHGNKAYGPDDIEYTFNSYGYRSIEPDPNSPNKKIMFVGCSHTQGIGLPHHEMWATITCELLQEHYGFEIEQHNFGLSGHGNDTHAMNVFQILPVLKPDVLVVFFSDPGRLLHFRGMNDYITLGPWGESSDPLWKPYAQLQNDANDFYRLVSAYQTIDMSAKLAGIPWVGAIQEQPSLPDDYFRVDRLLDAALLWRDAARGDLARDGFHAGAKGNRRFGEVMAEKIKNLGVL